MYFPRNGDGLPRKKYYKFEREEEGQVPNNFWGHEEFGSNQEASEEIKEIGIEFDNPKPVKLIKALMTIFTNKDSLALDSFASSGTTAQAVLSLNKEDGGNRKFILVECEDYADNITAERVRRVIKGVPTAKDETLKQGLGGTFSYFELKNILEGDKLPSYQELARYVFYTATNEEFKPEKVDEATNFIGESKDFKVYLLYKPNIDYLKSTSLNTEEAEKLGPYSGKKRLVFAPAKYLDTDNLLEFHIEFCQLPFEIYKLKE
jgi:adenine-specific DNA-methyltransferase